MPRRSKPALTAEFGGGRPRILIEPGRYLVGDAGLLRAEILLISRKSPHERERWVYLDAGLYNGLDETLGERIHYRIRTLRDGGARGPVIVAGPTCDSADILYRRHPYELPLDLAIGDPIDFLSAGRLYRERCRGSVQRVSPDPELFRLMSSVYNQDVADKVLGKFAQPHGIAFGRAGLDRQQSAIQLDDPPTQGRGLGRRHLDLQSHRKSGKPLADPLFEPGRARD
jgi:hypothetical protein